MSKKWYNLFVVSDAKSPNEPAPKAGGERVVDAIPAARSEATFTAPVKETGSFDELYGAAQIIAPAHGYTILKVAEMLQSEHIRALPNDVKQKSVMVALDAAGVKVREIVEDAVQRDKALDAYERVLQKTLDNLRSQKELENRRLEEEVNQKLVELRARVAENNKEVEKEQQSLLAWRTRKRQEEERIADAVGYFVTENPVTTSGTSTKRKEGSENVR